MTNIVQMVEKINSHKKYHSNFLETETFFHPTEICGFLYRVNPITYQDARDYLDTLVKTTKLKYVKKILKDCYTYVECACSESSNELQLMHKLYDYCEYVGSQHETLLRAIKQSSEPTERHSNKLWAYQKCLQLFENIECSVLSQQESCLIRRKALRSVNTVYSVFYLYINGERDIEYRFSNEDESIVSLRNNNTINFIWYTQPIKLFLSSEEITDDKMYSLHELIKYLLIAILYDKSEQQRKEAKKVLDLILDTKVVS